MTSALSTITVRVLLFGSYAEILRAEALDVALDAPATVADIVQRLRAMPGGESLPPKPLCAVNLSHASDETPVAPGDEVAILPPLAGG
jgi:molybdopterin converting factor small subunit